MIQASLGLTEEYHEVFQLEAPGVPELLEGPLEYPRLGAPPPSEGLFSLSQAALLANVGGGGLRSSRVVVFGLPSTGSSSALGSIAQEKMGDLAVWAQSCLSESMEDGTPVREITDRYVSQSTTGYLSETPTRPQMETPDSTSGLPLPEYFSPEPSPAVVVERREVSACADGLGRLTDRYSRGGLGLVPSDGGGLHLGCGLPPGERDQTSEVMAQQEG